MDQFRCITGKGGGQMSQLRLRVDKHDALPNFVISKRCIGIVEILIILIKEQCMYILHCILYMYHALIPIKLIM